MKRLFLLFFVFFLFLFNFALLGAFELEVTGGINFMTFNPQKSSAYSESDTEIDFIPYPYAIGNVNFRHNFTETLNFSLNIERDNVLQTSLSTIIGAKTDFINVKFGVFMGWADFTDQFNPPDAGFIGNLELIAFKTLYFSIYGSSSLGILFDFDNDNSRETAGIKLGFHVGNFFPSVSADMKCLLRRFENDIFTDDTLYRLFVNLDFLIKDFNISGFVNAGYQSYTRNYIISYPPEEHINAFLAGFGLTWHHKPLGVKLGFEMPFIALKDNTLMYVSTDYLKLCNFYAGVIYSFDK